MATAATDGRPEVRAEARWVRISPRKARLVAEHIRGRSVPEARTVLAFSDRAAAREVAKVLASAVANAEANHNLAGDNLLVSAAFVDEGPTMKRWRARARGRAARIRKRTCHITVKLAENPRVERPAPPPVPAQTAEEPTSEAKAEARRPRAKKPETETTTAEKPKRAPRKKKEGATT